MKYGIFGLTGDPCTSAHYEIVNKLLNDKLVDKVIIIPTVVDYYRKDKARMFTNEQRLEIIKKWFDGMADVIVNDSEYKLIATEPESIEGRRYWHTLQAVIARYGTEHEYMTVVGADSWNNLESWFNFKELGKATKFIVVKRVDQTINSYANYLEYHNQPYKVISLNKKLEKVSATAIRERLLKRKDIDCFKVYLGEVKCYLTNRKKKTPAIKKAKSKAVKSEELLAHTPIFDLIKAPEVEAGFRPIQIKSPDWASVIVECCGKFLMTKQLRHGLNKEFEEFPCGMIEANELPATAAQRELKEETGIDVRKNGLKYLGKFATNPAFMTNYMHYYYVNLEEANWKTTDIKLDKHEHLTSYWVDKKEAFENFIKSEGSAIMGAAWMLLMKEGIAERNN